MKAVAYHDAADIFPLDEEHIDKLAKDIKGHGQRMPIELLDGKIIDGRRRYLACQRLGIEPDFCDADEEAADDPVAYVLSLNLHRRHLTNSQASMCAARARDWYAEQAKERQRAAGGDRKSAKARSVMENFPQPISKGTASDQVGKVFGVSGKNVDKARMVINRGIPAVQEAVDAGKLSLDRAGDIATNPANLQEPLLESRLKNKKPPKSPRVKPNGIAAESPTANTKNAKGVILANEAINCLIRIPQNDPLRKRGFQIVTDWIKTNR